MRERFFAQSFSVTSLKHTDKKKHANVVEKLKLLHKWSLLSVEFDSER